MQKRQCAFVNVVLFSSLYGKVQKWKSSFQRMPPRNVQTSSGVAESLRSPQKEDDPNARTTQWRHFRHPPPGVRSVHPCLGNVPERPVTRSCATTLDDHVQELLYEPAAVSGSANEILKQKESVYASSHRDKLGECPDTKYEFPWKVNLANPAFTGHGVPTRSSENVKNVMFPSAVRTEPPALQRRPRGVDWAQAGVNPDTHTFGLVDKMREDNGVRDTLSAGTARCATIVSMPSYAHRAVNGDVGTGRPPRMHIDPTLRLGKPTDPDRDTIKDLMHWAGAQAQTQHSDPTEEVAKEPLKGRTSGPSSACGPSAAVSGSGTAFGIPTVRKDIVPPRHLRTDDSRNFGDDASVAALVPHNLPQRELLTTTCTKEELRNVLRANPVTAGLADPGAFEAAWTKSRKATLQGSAAPLSSTPRLLRGTQSANEVAMRSASSREERVRMDDFLQAVDVLKISLAK